MKALIYEIRLRVSMQLLFILALMLPFTSSAGPDSLADRSWDIHLAFGRTVTYGDLTANRFSKDGGWCVNMGADRFINPWFALRGNLVFGNLHGDGSLVGSNTKYYFNSRINTELTLSGLFQFCRLFCSGGYERMALFGTVGAGFLNTSPEVYQYGLSGSANYFVDKNSGTSENTADYRGRTHLVVPIGAGFKYRISDRISLQLSGCYRFTFSDEINGYVEKPGTNDGYMVYTTGLIVHLGKDRNVVQWKSCGPPADKLPLK